MQEVPKERQYVMAGQPDSNWNDFVGQRVQLHKDDNLVRIGYVEDVTYAADALWLRGHGAEPRTLYLKADGFTARILAETEGQNG
jgi:hypothetical protein